MTVKQLIDHLTGIDPDTEVVVVDSGDYDHEPVVHVDHVKTAQRCNLGCTHDTWRVRLRVDNRFSV